MIYLLFIMLIFLFAFSYFTTKKVFSPPCLICMSYIVAVFFAILNIDKWSINLSFKTVCLIIIGILSFIIPFFIMYAMFYKKNKSFKVKNEEKINYENEKIIKVDSKVINIFLLTEIFALVLYIYYSMKSLGIGWNILGFFSEISQYRLKKIGGEDFIGLPFYVKQLMKLSKAFFFVYSYIVLNNMIEYKKIGKKYNISLKYIMSIILLVIMCLFSASRFDIAVFIVYIFMLYYVLLIKKRIKMQINVKKIIKILLIVISIVYLFSSTKELFGRSGDYSVIDYISLYFGGSIELLDLYIKDPVQKSNIWGKETFFAINKTLSDIGLIKENYTLHLEWRYSNGICLGNVYTAFRMYYNDFGMMGIIILQTILSIIFSLGYFYILKEKKSKKIDIKVIIYCFLIFSLVLHSYRDFFYSQIVSVNYINIIFYIIIIKSIFENIRFKVGRGCIYEE